MRFAAKLIFISSLVYLVTKGYALPDHVVKHTGHWHQKHRAHKEHKVTVGFVLKQNNLDLIDHLFWERTNPKSPSYAQWLTRQQIADITYNQNAHTAVLDFLEQLKSENVMVTHNNPHGEYVKATMPVHVAERVFQTEFFEYGSVHEDGTVVKTQQYTIPMDLAMHLSHIEHIAHFPTSLKRPAAVKFQSFNDLADSGSTYVTPQLLQSVYGIPSTEFVTNAGATQSVFESLGQQFAPKDLTMFQTQYSLKQDPVYKVIGSNDPTKCYTSPDDCGEANLDVEYIMAVAQGSPTWYWYAPGDVEPFLDWIMAVGATSNPPKVHSISYGGYESDSTAANMNSFSDEAKKLALQGVTIVVSSGDDGSVNYQVRNGTSSCGYYTSFPSSCPYITSVGATQGPEAGSAEIACSSKTGGIITTGGGISRVFPLPAYQSAVVKSYLSKVSGQIAAGYPTNGRASPDVSALGRNYVISIGGQWTLVSGTSASAPVFAGMISLINSARLSRGKTTLGFLNQALYSMDSSVFNDITSGKSNCAAANQNGENCCNQGFIATTGWDPLTGLGSPHYPKLKAAFLAL